MENITLYEAMDTISDYLDSLEITEDAKPKIDYSKWDDYKNDRLSTIKRNAKRSLKEDRNELLVRGAITGASTLNTVRLAKKLKKIEDEIKEEENKKNPDKEKINKLKKKMNATKVAIGASTGVAGLGLAASAKSLSYVPGDAKRYKVSSKILKDRGIPDSVVYDAKGNIIKKV